MILFLRLNWIRKRTRYSVNLMTLINLTNFLNMKTNLLLIFTVFFATCTFGQRELSSFSGAGSGVTTAFLSDYQCLGINPANLGWNRSKAKFHFSFLEVGASVFSDALSKKQVKQDFIFNKKTTFSTQEKIDAAELFAGNKFAINADVAWLSFAFQQPKFGGIAFTIRERTTFNSFFNKDFAQIVFEGFRAPYFDSLVVNGSDTAGYASVPKTLGELSDGSKISGTWYREYVLGYGRQIISSDKFSFYVGADAKYLAGYGVFDVNSESGNMSGFSALTPYMDVNYNFTSPSQVMGTAMKTVGSGIAFDLGATVELFKKLRIGAAVNDIGSINWTGNVYNVKDTTLNMVYNKGFYSYNIIHEMKDLIQDSSVFRWDGEQSKRIALPTNARIGINYQFSEHTSIGADCYIPVNNNAGSFDKAIFGIGGNVGLFKMLTVSAGLAAGGNYDFVIPIGLSVSLNGGKWEMGIASRDAITFFTQNNPTVSACFGFLRFNMGKVDKNW